MKIAIMGSGAIGGFFGSHLARSGEEVTFIARGPHLEAMRSHGLRLESQFGDVTLEQVSATESPADVGHVDVVIFSVKLYDSDKAAAAIVPMVGPETRVVTFQNGVDSVSTLGRFVPPLQVIGGATYVSGYLKQPGLIVHVGGSTQFHVGGRDDLTMRALQNACIRSQRIDLQLSDDIDQVLWSKFVTLCAFSGATGLTRAGIGAILDDPEGRIFLDQLREEGAEVAAAAGHPMQDGFRERTASLWQNLPPDARSSMANDLLQGKPLELAWLSGRMHMIGKDLGVPTPSHTAVYRALHLYMQGTQRAR